MKLASLKSGRDGQLVVVSRDLSRAVSAAAVAPTLQAALDDWRRCRGELEALSEALNAGAADNAFDFDPREPGVARNQLHRFRRYPAKLVLDIQ